MNSIPKTMKTLDDIRNMGMSICKWSPIQDNIWCGEGMADQKQGMCHQRKYGTTILKRLLSYREQESHL